jgi:triosephosphate isomerase
MARKLFIAGNWKMNLNSSSSVKLAEGLVAKLGGNTQIDLAVCPPFPYLLGVGKALANSRILLGAQDVFYENDGAYTGEVSTAMLKDCRCAYAIVGHSERRHVIGETDELINRKVLKCLADGIGPIFCVGELLAERQAAETLEVVSRQVKLGLEGVSAADVTRAAIAYEPVWAIGTGVVATVEQAQEVHKMIRDLLAKLYDPATAQQVRIQYGGSVKPSNAGELLACPDIDGALVGGASLKVEDFAGIVAAGMRKP